jgi:hypothetical protein
MSATYSQEVSLMQQDPQHPEGPTVYERQMRALLAVIDPARAALLDVEPDDQSLDDVAIRDCVDQLRRVGAARDGSTAGRMLDGMAELLETRWFG